MKQTLPPLAVDLDGTLVLGDTLHESLLALLRKNPLYLLLLPIWLLRGKAGFKAELAKRMVPPATDFRYNEALLQWLHQQQEQRALILCTAADERIATAVADHLDLFESVLASDGTTNLSGSNKAAALCRRYGEGNFDYAGNARSDYAVWRHARAAVVVNAGSSVLAGASQVASVAHVLPPPLPQGVRAWLRALRPHQWAKNLLVFVPLLTAHLLDNGDAISGAVLAFVAFCLCASSVYILNDLLDLAADRAHPRKRNRPFASGQLSVLAGLLLAPALLAAAFAVAAFLPSRFVLALIGYYLLTLLYSFALKRQPALDVVVLAMLYTARIVAGTFAIAIETSFWLLAFSMFVFLSLALVKRYTELQQARERGLHEAAGRGYRTEDLPIIGSLGTSAGYASVLVLALYVNSLGDSMLYSRPNYLWLMCPLMLYWISRVWLLTQRGRMHDDPLMFALRDPVSAATLATLLVLVAIAT